MTKQDKQQNTIREMANKKLLTGEQKKVLYKMFESKINNLKQAKQTEQRVKLETIEKEILKKEKSSKTFKKLLSIIKEADKSKDKAKKEIEKRGFNLDYYGNNISINYMTNKEIDKISTDHHKKIKEIEELKNKLLADIYCLPLTAQEMTNYIEEEIKAIDKSI